uniref:Uncharacterized protein n=1 Tax=Rhizophora mucronata TaxID=61149 RepID=A0A2P2QNU9_RHIMU
MFLQEACFLGALCLNSMPLAT